MVALPAQQAIAKGRNPDDLGRIRYLVFKIHPCHEFIRSHPAAKHILICIGRSTIGPIDAMDGLPKSYIRWKKWGKT